MNYSYVISPITNKKVSIYSSSGKTILKLYLRTLLGGYSAADDDDGWVVIKENGQSIEREAAVAAAAAAAAAAEKERWLAEKEAMLRREGEGSLQQNLQQNLNNWLTNPFAEIAVNGADYGYTYKKWIESLLQIKLIDNSFLQKDKGTLLTIWNSHDQTEIVDSKTATAAVADVMKNAANAATAAVPNN